METERHGTMRLHYYLMPRHLLAINRALWQSYGLRTPLVVISRVAVYGWFLLFRAKKTFSLAEREYPYAVNLQNATFRTERTVEIPIALQMFPLAGDILEVGNVLSQYLRFPHDVVDKYEKADGVQNVDIVDYCPEKRYDLIVSISTLEHVGWDESPREPQKVIRALQHLKTLLKPGGRMLVTVPLGYNAFLDACVQDGSLEFSRVLFMKRTSRMNDWVQTTCGDATTRKFGVVYPCASAIAIGVI